MGLVSRICRAGSPGPETVPATRSRGRRLRYRGRGLPAEGSRPAGLHQPRNVVMFDHLK